MLSKTLQKKKETQGTTRNESKYVKKKQNHKRRGRTATPAPHRPNPQGPAHALSLQGKKRAGGQMERYVFCISHITHFCYTSTRPLLLPFFCSLATTVLIDDENQ